MEPSLNSSRKAQPSPFFVGHHLGPVLHQIGPGWVLKDTGTIEDPPAIPLLQALSIRPDLLSPRAMVELQKLCDKATMLGIQQDQNISRQEVVAKIDPAVRLQDPSASVLFTPWSHFSICASSAFLGLASKGQLQIYS